MKKVFVVLAIAAFLFGCAVQPPSLPDITQALPSITQIFAPNATQGAVNATPNATLPIQPLPPANNTPAGQPHTVLVPYEVNETYLEEVLVKERVLVGPQNVRVQNLTIARVNEVQDSEDDCKASLVLGNPNPFGVYFNAEFKGVMDSAPANQMHFNVDNLFTQAYVSANSETTLPSAEYHPAQYMGPYKCRIDLSTLKITILEQDGIHYVEIENTIFVNKTRTTIMYRNETVT